MGKRVELDDESAFKEALRFKTRIDFKKYSISAYTYCWRNNLLDRACKHMDKFGVDANEERNEERKS